MLSSRQVHNLFRETAYLGNGAFGTVHKEVWSHSGGGSDQVVEEDVAVKSLENGTSEEERVKFLQEAAIMGQFNHPNIVRIMGISIKENKVQGHISCLINIKKFQYPGVGLTFKPGRGGGGGGGGGGIWGKPSSKNNYY